MRWLCWLMMAAPVFGQAWSRELLDAKLVANLAAFDSSVEGALGVAVIDLKTGTQHCFHCDTWFPTASTIKVPVLVEVMRRIRAGELRYEQSVPVSSAEVIERGAYERAALGAGSISLRELIRLMIQDSDNAATNKLIDLAGGFAAVNARMDSLNLPAIRLRRKMLDLPAAREERENIATPREMARLAAMLHRGEVLDADSSREILGFMRLVEGEMRPAASPFPTATKTGTLSGVRCEFGVVQLAHRSIALAVFSSYLSGKSPVPGATKIVVEHYQKLDRANSAGRFLE